MEILPAFLLPVESFWGSSRSGSSRSMGRSPRMRTPFKEYHTALQESLRDAIEDCLPLAYLSPAIENR